ncbi:hypothetical protein M2271_001733 [Streptomyces sp. LBL]|uniref:VC0807 family protein n=1 Tax=Streptomyces sp. LBL TaxID=2940562 RepID=UPI002473B179|nr:VC0807 family protein [Streptomyces sp. LBL]MDH6623941.1 hypothetical protein [Streptomyces sp. LBL]
MTKTKRNALAPLMMDVAVPVGSYYLFRNAIGMSTAAALGWSSVLPAVRTGWSVAKDRTVNGLAALILFVNVAGVLLAFVAGDPRLMLAKDSGVSSVVGIGILASVVMGKPVMTAGMKPWLVKGDERREAAWVRLQGGSAAFRRCERVFSVVWGVVLLGECVVRVVGVYTLPVDTMVWLGNVIMVVAMALGFLVSGALGAGPMAAMLEAELVSLGQDRGDGQGQELEQGRGQGHLDLVPVVAGGAAAE